MAFPVEVARYLSVEPRDVKDMIRLDGLPALPIPKKKRTVDRIPLRDFHAWLKKRPKAPLASLATYEAFLADFNAVSRSPIQTP